MDPSRQEQAVWCLVSSLFNQTGCWEFLQSSLQRELKYNVARPTTTQHIADQHQAVNTQKLRPYTSSLHQSSQLWKTTSENFQLRKIVWQPTS